MQALLGNEPQATKAFRATISEARFGRYLKESNGEEADAIALYHWNALLSQSLYLPLQVWEVALRNRLNNFLKSRYGRAWPHDEALRRALLKDGVAKVDETIRRFDPLDQKLQVATDRIVADLSAGFWVGLLAQRYEQGFRWRRSLPQIFPHLADIDRAAIHRACHKLLKLRNRVAHHEPILTLPLVELKEELDRQVAGMCPATATYAKTACTFERVWAAKPALLADKLAAGVANENPGSAVAETAQLTPEIASAGRPRPTDPR